jgi:hypothetical protein
VRSGWNESSEGGVTHLFVNVFEFAEEIYVAKATVRAEEEDIGLLIDPTPHPDVGDAVELFLDEWLEEVVICHDELRRTVT